MREERVQAAGVEAEGRARGLCPLAPSPRTILATLPLRPGQAALVWGGSLRPLAAAAAAWGVSRGAGVLVVDAANRFDPYALVRAARQRGMHSRQTLLQVQVARAFTCHQLVRLLREELPPHLASGALVLGLGPVSLFYDEQVPLGERRRLFRELVDILAAVKTRSPLLLLQPLLPKEAPNRQFGKLLAPVLDYLVQVRRDVDARAAQGAIVPPFLKGGIYGGYLKLNVPDGFVAATGHPRLE